MVWRLRETWALQVDFFQFCTSREGIQHICLVYTKLHALSYGYRLSLFLRGPIALHGLVHFLNTTGPFLTKVVYAYFDRTSCIYIYIYNTYIQLQWSEKKGKWKGFMAKREKFKCARLVTKKLRNADKQKYEKSKSRALREKTKNAKSRKVENSKSRKTRKVEK